MGQKISKVDILLSNDFIDYSASIEKFKEYVSKKSQFIWSLEHKDVYTFGNSVEHFKNNSINDIPVVKSDRGGLWTFHGKGQVVLYFCIDLVSFFKKIKEKIDIDFIVSGIEKIGIKSLEQVDVLSFVKKDLGRGIWCLDSNGDFLKIGFIGIRISKGYLLHGMSINYDNDLSLFDPINPCGINCKLTSVLNQTNSYRKFNKLEFKKILIRNALKFFKIDNDF